MSLTALKHILKYCITLVCILGLALKPTPKSPPLQGRGLHAVNRGGFFLALARSSVPSPLLRAWLRAGLSG